MECAAMFASTIHWYTWNAKSPQESRNNRRRGSNADDTCHIDTRQVNENIKYNVSDTLSIHG